MNAASIEWDFTSGQGGGGGNDNSSCTTGGGGGGGGWGGGGGGKHGNVSDRPGGGGGGGSFSIASTRSDGDAHEPGKGFSDGFVQLVFNVNPS